MNEIIVSIYMTTYNHEKYIREALDSILMQKVNFNYEVLVGDDVSQDNTRSILKEYEKNYPDLIKVFYRDHNLMNERPNNGEDLRQRCVGKYVIALEGDDFWVDENKLQFQVDFLENNPEYIAVAHNCIVVDDDSKANGEEYQECKDNIYTFEHFTAGILPGQLTTVMYRNYMKDNSIDSSIMDAGLRPGDRNLYFMLCNYGKIFCEQKIRSAYRHNVNSGSSYSANYRYDFVASEKWSRNMIEYAYKVGNKDAVTSAEILYWRTIKMGVRRKACNKFQAIRFLVVNIKNVPIVFLKISIEKMKRDINNK